MNAEKRIDKFDYLATTDVGACSACPGTFTVTKKGNIRHHLGDKLETNGVWRKRCEGAGKPPRQEAP